MTLTSKAATLAYSLAAALLAAAPAAAQTPLPSSITYDATGMPRVVAANEAAGYAGLCYAMAKDRLFQMDLLRRSAYGRLAEIFGPGPKSTVLQQDLSMRVQEVKLHAQARFDGASMPTRNVLSACAYGVNKFIGEATQTHSLPPEFGVLQYSPEPWAPRDSVAILIYLGSGFSNIGAQIKLQRAALSGVFGAPVAAALIPAIPETPSLFDSNGRHVPQMPSFGLPQPQARGTAEPTAVAHVSPKDLADFRLPEAAFTRLIAPLQATNSVVVGGRRSITGKPLLANDPHLQLANPSAFYFAQLEVNNAAAFNIRGAAIPGVPVFLLGQNAIATWGISIAGVDDTDLYLETVSQVGDKQYVTYRGNQVPVLTRYESVAVAGQPAVQLRVRRTPHGPLLNDALPALDAFGPLSMKSTYTQPEWKIDGYFQLPRAIHWGLFKAALGSTGIGLNFVYADNAGNYGNIGYQMAGLVPQRRAENLMSPVPGANGYEWTGFATDAQLPSVLNPGTEFLAVANNRIVPSNYAPGGRPVTIGAFLEQPWRMQRAVNLVVQAGPAVRMEELAQLQLDTHNAVGKSMANLYAVALRSVGLPPNDPNAVASFAALETWDGNVSAGSKGALIYEVLTALLLQDTVQNVVGAQMYQNYVQGVFVTRRVDALWRLLAQPRAPFFGIQNGDNPILKRNLAVRAALAKADELIRGTLGQDHAAWNWGQLHTLTYNHPLAAAPLPGNPFALPTSPAQGDFATLNIGWWATQVGLLALPAADLAAAGGPRAAFAQDSIAAVRTLWDADNRFGSLGVLSTGQSGNPASPHWADQGALWRAGKYVPLTHDGHR